MSDEKDYNLPGQRFEQTDSDVFEDAEFRLDTTTDMATGDRFTVFEHHIRFPAAEVGVDTLDEPMKGYVCLEEETLRKLRDAIDEELEEQW